MPTARELLERADALMRRNRKRGKQKHGDVPTLTDALGVDHEATLAPTIILPEIAPTEADPISLDTLSDVPVLTDVVAESRFDSASPVTPAVVRVDDVVRSAPLLQPADPRDAAKPFATLVDALGRGAISVPAAIGAASGTLSSRALVDEEFILEIPPAPEEAPVIPPAADAPATSFATEAPEALAPGSGEWEALAEELRMQVLQRLDLFTDTGLREQLGQRVKPIVDRASAELIETINHELGELVRGYVAEAIEREIESWRERNT